MKTLLTLSISLLVTISAYSQQSEFSPGYVVTITGDTLRGNVKDRKYGFRDELINKLTVRRENGKMKRIKKKNVIAYEWGGEKFERMKVSTEIPFVKIDVSSEQFMVKVVNGLVELYKHYYNDFESGTVEYIYFIKDKRTDNFKRLPVIGFKPIIRKYFLGKDQIIAKLDNNRYGYWNIPELIREGNSEGR